ncbi:MAG: DUF2914 domain-containing protein [Desulfosarcinaceae bacterium]
MKSTRLFLLVPVVLLVVAGLAVPGWSEGEKQEAGEAPASKAGVQIQDAVVCQDVVNREPVGSGDVFAKETPKVYCFCRVVGAQGETQITENWYYKGNLKASVELPVRSDNWRTWSSKTMDPAWTGEWMVEILSKEGTPLESIIFFVQ